MTKIIVPEWLLPNGVGACSSTRVGRVSQGAWDSLNLGAHCGDNLELVEENRKRMFAAGKLPSKPVWLDKFTARYPASYRRALCF
ncbi:laccase domain-containing protein [Escherichia coli]